MYLFIEQGNILNTKAENRSHVIGYVLAIIGAFSFSSYILSNKFAYKQITVNSITYIATFLLTAGIIALFELIFSGEIKVFKEFFKKDTSRKPFPYWFLILNGFASSIGYVLVAFGQQHTSAANASLITAANIIPTAAFGWLLSKTKISLTQFFSLLFVLAGLYVAIVGFDLVLFKSGDLIIAVGSIIFGFTNSFAKKIMARFSPRLVSTFRLMTGGLGGLLVLIAYRGENYFDINYLKFPIVSGICLYLSVKFIMIAMSHIDANVAVIIVQLHILISPIVAVSLLSEKYRIETLIGSIIMLSSVILFAFENRKTLFKLGADPTI